MKMNLNNLSLIKMVIRMLILLILCIVLFILACVFYSVQYWPDIHNYLHANITIKRIPTLSELNLTVIHVENIDFTTENGFTDYTESVTGDDLDIDFEEFTRIEELKTGKRKRDVPIETFENDYVELPKKHIVDYVFVDFGIVGESTTKVETTTEAIVAETIVENEDTDDKSTIVENDFVGTKIVKDLIDESKLVPKNIGDVEIMNSLNEIPRGEMRLQCHGKTKGIKQVLPWLAAIFIKEKAGSDQFSYYCDAVLVQDRFLITAGRCMKDQNGTTVNPNDVLVFLGKRSLQVVSENEKTVRISKVQIHHNFTSRDGALYQNDLAILKMEEAVKSSDVIRPACFDDGKQDEVEQTATVAWTQTGDLTPVYFEKNSKCTDVDDIVCATYGNNVALCPNYGGIYAVRRSKQWYVHGIRTGDPSDRNICFDKNVKYTSLDNYMDWILDNTNN